MRQQRVRAIVLAALFAALTALGAWIRIPLPTGVPLTLQVPAVLLSGLVLGPGRGAASQAVYLLCGLLGLPVFATGGGPAYVLAPTFGFLAAFPAAAAVSGAVAGRVAGASRGRLLAAMACGLAVVYAVGVPWLWGNFLLVQKKALPPAVLETMPVFLLLDAAKALLLLPLVRILGRRAAATILARSP